jgi:hypothetical protein
MSRPRSRAIAIKRSSNKASGFEAASSAEKMYDYATWQMYNRIIAYRQKNPVGGNSSTSNTSASSVEDDSSLSEANQDCEKQTEEAIYDDSQDEIFHMEL